MAIVGHGDIASALIDHPDRLYFASGVSNSARLHEREYQREVNLLASQGRSLRLVYFSSLCVFYSYTRYAKHKRNMEVWVKKLFPHWTIIRLGNITWGANPHTLINHLREHYINAEPVDIQDTYRYVVDREEFRHWLGLIPPWNCEMNITGRRLKVADIYQEFVTDALARA